MNTPLPAYLTQSQGPRLAERTVQHLGAAAQPYLSIEGNRFTLIDATGAEEPVITVDAQTGMPYIDGVVIDALEVESKIYYKDPYGGKQAAGKPPDCWSDNGVTPSRNAGTPQSPTCAACPQAVWGSKIGVSGKGVPACGKYQKLALMLPGDDVMFLLRVPPNSLSNLRDYLHRFRGQNFDVKDVITRISFVKDQLGTLVFHATQMIEEPVYRQREAAYVAKATDQLVGRGDLPRDALPAPATRQISHSPENRQDIQAFVPRDPAGNVMAPTPPTAQPGFVPAPMGQANYPAQTATAPVQPPPAERPKRTRRTAAQIAADNAASGQMAPPAPQPQGVQQAPFRPAPPPIMGAGNPPQAGQPAAGTPNGPFAQQGQPAGNFGIQQGVAPNAEIQQTLDSIFK